MNYENCDLYAPDSQELDTGFESISEDIEMTKDTEEVTDQTRDIPHASFNPAVIAYGANRIQEIPAVKEFVSDCKETFGEKVSDSIDAAKEYIENISENIKDFSKGVYDSVTSYFSDSKEVESKECAMYSKEFSETREFGIDHCVEAANEYFNPGVISEWMNLSNDERAEICYAYADEVAKAFELEEYNGVVFEQLEPGTLGYNAGDGYIHLATDLLNPMMTPLNLVDTITHELRHQYQSECVDGYHDVADEVRNEWAMATEIYTNDDAWCYDPWGYMYNPLEIDSRFAGETVVREISSKMFNDALASA